MASAQIASRINKVIRVPIDQEECEYAIPHLWSSRGSVT